MHNPADLETIAKLRFILNRSIRPIVASRAAIHNAINQYYGQIEGESADSMLQEFTDTAIDFTETCADYMPATEDDFEASSAAADYAAHSDSIEECGILDNLGGAFGFAPPRAPSPSVRSGHVSRKGKRESREAELVTAPVVRLVTLIFAESVKLRATHILLRAMDDGIQVVYLIDGKETLRDRVPKRLLRQILQRLMVLAHVDPMANDQYQSGTCDVTIGDRTIRPEVHFAPNCESEFVMIDMQANDSTVPEIIQQWNRRFGADSTAPPCSTVAQSNRGLD